MATLARMPHTTVGRKRREDWRGERCCASWKLEVVRLHSFANMGGEGAYNKVVKYPNGLKAPQVRNTEIQLQVKAVFFQMEFGITAGLPRFSWRCIQYTNAGKRERAMESMAMLAGSLMLDELPVITLS